MVRLGEINTPLNGALPINLDQKFRKILKRLKRLIALWILIADSDRDLRFDSKSVANDDVNRPL